MRNDRDHCRGGWACSGVRDARRKARRGRARDGYGYSQYCELYRERKALRSPVVLQEHKAGENLFVDYAGQAVPVWDAG